MSSLSESALLPAKTAKVATHGLELTKALLEQLKEWEGQPDITPLQKAELVEDWIRSVAWYLFMDSDCRILLYRLKANELTGHTTDPETGQVVPTDLWEMLYQTYILPARPHYPPDYWQGMWQLWLTDYLKLDTVQPVPIAAEAPCVEALRTAMEHDLAHKQHTDKFYDGGARQQMLLTVPVGSARRYLFLRPYEYGFLDAPTLLKFSLPAEEANTAREFGEKLPTDQECWSSLSRHRKDVWLFQLWISLLDTCHRVGESAVDYVAMRREDFESKGVWERLTTIYTYPRSKVGWARPLFIHNPLADDWLILDRKTGEIWRDSCICRAILFWQYLVDTRYQGRLGNNALMPLFNNIVWRREIL